MRRKEPESLKLFAKFKELIAMFPSASDREIARMLGVSHPTVAKWREKVRHVRNPRKTRLHTLYLLMPQELREKLKTALEALSKEKGITRRTAKARIYKLLEIDFAGLGVKDQREGTRLISHFVKQEYGSWEKLEQKVRPKKEKPKYRTSKGKLKRTPGTLAIDATGYTFTLTEEGKEVQISVFIAGDVYTGCLYPEPLLVDNREKEVKFYNKAFNSRSVAKFLIEIFTVWGVPQEMVSDSDPVLRNEYTNNALGLLNISRTFVKHANQNPIERYIKEVKEWIRANKIFSERPKTKEEIYEKVKLAIDWFNRTEHRFDHFKEPVVPQEILPASLREYTREEEHIIRDRFMEVEERVVRNNTITWDSYKYEFILPERLREGEVGRKPKPPKVIVKRHIDNASYLEVYDARTKEFLGIAKLYSQDVPTVDPTERKELKDAEKRARKRMEKLSKEMSAISQIKFTPAHVPQKVEEEDGEEETLNISILSKLANEYED